jgi:hypothetical protein
MKMIRSGQDYLDQVRLRERQEDTGPRFVNPSGALLLGFTLVECYRHHPWTWAHGLWLCGVVLAACVAGYVWQAFWLAVLARLARREASRRCRH